MSEALRTRSPQAVVNRARFAGKDFFTFADDLVARLKEQYGDAYNDFLSVSLGQMLVDIVAWACETLSFYIDRQASESYLATARTRRAVARLARQIGYVPSGAVPASVDLKVRLGAVQSVPVTIPKGFQFRDPIRGLTFEAVSPVTFPAGDGPTSTPKIVSVAEGVSRTETFVSDGSRNQRYSLSLPNGRMVSHGSVKVYVGGVQWQVVDMLTFEAANRAEISYDEPAVRFGDGVTGNFPAAGVEVKVEYFATKGSSGMVPSGSITDVVSPLTVGSSSVPLLIEQPLPTTGGADQESLDEIRATAPGFFSARGVAVTRDDYIKLAEAFTDPFAGSVGAAQAYVVRGAAGDLTLIALIGAIKGLVLSTKTAVLAGLTGSKTSVADAASLLATAQASIVALSSLLDDIADNPLTPTMSGLLKDARVALEQLRGNIVDAQVLANEGLAQTTLAAKDARFTAILSELSVMFGQVDGALGHLASIEAKVASANTENAAIGTSVSFASGHLTSATSHLTIAEAQLNSGFDTQVSEKLDEIFEHADSFLQADCKANLVQVPILGLSSDGFYVEPSVALIRQLERYLSERCEVTQVVEVISGGSALVAADITAKVGIKQGYSQPLVTASVKAAIESVLRGRPFGKSLRLSELYAAVAPDQDGRGGVDGVAYATIKITGPGSFLSPDGDLIIGTGQVITKGSITVTAEAA